MVSPVYLCAICLMSRSQFSLPSQDVRVRRLNPTQYDVMAYYDEVALTKSQAAGVYPTVALALPSVVNNCLDVRFLKQRRLPEPIVRRRRFGLRSRLRPKRWRCGRRGPF